MTTEKKAKIYYIISLICGIWFLLLGWYWVFFVNIFFVFPVALIGFFLWLKARSLDPQSILRKICLVVYSLALVVSFGVLFLYK